MSLIDDDLSSWWRSMLYEAFPLLRYDAFPLLMGEILSLIANSFAARSWASAFFIQWMKRVKALEITYPGRWLWISLISHDTIVASITAPMFSIELLCGTCFHMSAPCPLLLCFTIILTRLSFLDLYLVYYLRLLLRHIRCEDLLVKH